MRPLLAFSICSAQVVIERVMRCCWGTKLEMVSVVCARTGVPASDAAEIRPAAAILENSWCMSPPFVLIFYRRTDADQSIDRYP